MAVFVLTLLVAAVAPTRPGRLMLAAGPLVFGDVGVAGAIYSGPGWLVSGIVLATGIAIAANWQRLVGRYSRD
jgi:uncharacterized protein YqgC (DUF456 family)